MLTLPKSESKNIKVKIRYNSPVIAPIKAETQLGELIIHQQDKEVKYPLFASHDVEEAGFFDRISANLSRLFD